MKKRRPLVRAIVLIVVAALVYAIGRFTGLVNALPKLSFNAAHILNGILILLLLFICESIISFVLELLKPRLNRSRTMISLAKNILRYAVILIAICVILSMFSVDIGTILAGLGIIALIIGFGAESLIADVVTGLFILIDNQYNVGDIIEINGFRGTVTDVSVRTTVLTDVGGNVKILDNDFHPIEFEERNRLLQDPCGGDSQLIPSRPIRIGKNCFIGCNAIILKGTVLGDGCVVGAGAVVSGTFEPNCVIAGNPAKIIRKLGAKT